MPPLHNPAQNHLLAALDDTEFQRLLPSFELVPLAYNDVIYCSGDELSYVYFPTDAIISIGYILEDGGASEIASVGSEGLLGISLFMGGQSTPNRAVVQTAGYAYRLSAARLLAEFYRKGPLLRLLLRYAQLLMTQISQTAVCNAHHSVEQRLCRWMLQATDRSHTSELFITHESISNILGVRREAVSEVAGHLQALGIIRCSRGHICTLDRVELEAHSCECYQVVLRETARLLASGDSVTKAFNWQKRGGRDTRRLGFFERRQIKGHIETQLPFGSSQTSFQFL